MIGDWKDLTNAEKADFVGALFIFVVVASVLGNAYLNWLGERDKRTRDIAACMYDLTPCEYARCVSVVEDIPMTQELSDACP